MISAPVGKSGPLISRITASSSLLAFGLGVRSTHSAAAATSRRLCGGIWVAMPTAMPADPLTSRFGKRLGSTTGRSVLPS